MACLDTSFLVDLIRGKEQIKTLLEEGISVNATLIFSVKRYKKTAEAYIKALRTRARKGLSLRVMSVASFFVSRMDTAVDHKLKMLISKPGAISGKMKSLAGKAALANCASAHAEYVRLFASSDFKRLAAKGALPQKIVWASRPI